MASRSAATATVRAVKRRSLIPTKAALSLTKPAVDRKEKVTDHVTIASELEFNFQIGFPLV